MTTTAATPARRASRTLPATSIVLAVGPSSRASRLAQLVNLVNSRAGLELVVVEDGADVALRERLATCSGNIRVRHNRMAFGTRGALAAGASTALADLLVLVADDTALSANGLDSLLACFDDPGVALAHAGEDGRPPGAVALRRGALDAAGGVLLLAGCGDVSGATEHGAGIPLLDPRLGPLLAAYGWRDQRAAVTVRSAGTMPYWPSSGSASPVAPAPWHPVAQPARLQPGVNLIGLLEAVCGLGDAARLYAEALAAAAVPFATFSWHGHGSAHAPYVHRGNGTLAHDTNLIAMNSDVLQTFTRHGGREVFQRRRNIGLWFWELEELHPRLLPGLKALHELWASTTFLRDVFATHTDLPVVRIPLPVRRREGQPALTRDQLGLPDAFCFLVVFDFNSVALRKNSLGAVEAFCRAFKPGEGPVLVLKTSNAHIDPRGWRALQQAIGGRRDVILLDGNLSDDAISAMVGSADCLVSLHRAEGFGLCLADAMAWGRPVIATAYSGNLDFMTQDNSYLVPHGWSRVPGSLGHIYPVGARWAEPDLAAAAAAMRRVWSDPVDAAARARRGQEDIRRTNSVDAAAHAIAARLLELGRLPARDLDQRPRPGATKGAA